jgi:AcrR family transcriptional regulator
VTSTEQPPAAPGLRQLKKQRTRLALIEAALKLFEAQGYEQTSVDEIAAAVDVSQRTFFRYFAGKEQVVLELADEVSARFIAALDSRPATEGSLTSVRRAMHELVTDRLIEADQPGAGTIELFSRAMLVIQQTPALVAADIVRRSHREQQMIEVVARRQGVDPRTDPRPRLLVAVFEALTRVAGETWCASGSRDLDDLDQIFDLHLDQLRPALADRWT